MTRQFFEVGEEVSIVCPDCPDFDCDSCTITKIKHSKGGDVVAVPTGGEQLKSDVVFCVTTAHPDYWLDQEFLRKRHKPADPEAMNNLYELWGWTPETVVAQAEDTG